MSTARLSRNQADRFVLFGLCSQSGRAEHDPKVIAKYNAANSALASTNEYIYIGQGAEDGVRAGANVPSHPSDASRSSRLKGETRSCSSRPRECYTSMLHRSKWSRSRRIIGDGAGRQRHAKQWRSATS